MKNLANCTPREFMAQTVKIKKYASEWMKKTNISNIRKMEPELNDGMTAAEKKAAWNEQANKNLSAIFDELAEKHPEETLNLLAMLCFVEPENIDDNPMSDYISSLNEMLGSEAVMGFFISLVKLARSGIFRL